jgi:hypothetical protein
MFDLEHIIGRAPNVLRDSVTVQWTPAQGPKDQQLEGALDELPRCHGR